ncbi:DUF6941 family protein [Pararhodospirillum oryzae]|uniref:Uncharacterized protein n=1 Tax=Pararhodospirillum oryzae TaxID=478448 RepID=A0A512H5J3_9PROT|nr:hypothetical protein [Pararhodospirillum oryzae]GEO80707.1 hypothetical protein ROR02_08380 [Pararhodospirillum oryzae]
MTEIDTKVIADVVFCDDIRNESDGKISLIGVHTQDMAVPKLPYFLPKLGLVVSLFFKDLDAIDEITVEISHGEDVFPFPIEPEVLEKVRDSLKSRCDEDGETSDYSARFRFSGNFLLSPFRLNAPEPILVDIMCARDRVHAGRLRVTLQEEG